MERRILVVAFAVTGMLAATAGTALAGVPWNPPEVNPNNPSVMLINAPRNWAFSINNTNTGTLTSVGFTVTLPSGLQVQNASVPAGCSGTSVVSAPYGFSFSGLSLAGSAQCPVWMKVVGTTAGHYSFSTGAPTSDQRMGSPATVSVDVDAPPVFTSVFSPAAVAVGATSTLSFSITNPALNTGPMSPIAFSETLPLGLSVANLSESICGGTVSVTAPRTISLAGAATSPGSTCHFSVTVTGATAGSYVAQSGAVTVFGDAAGTTSANLRVGNTAAITSTPGSASSAGPSAAVAAVDSPTPSNVATNSASGQTAASSASASAGASASATADTAPAPGSTGSGGTGLILVGGIGVLAAAILGGVLFLLRGRRRA